MIAVTRERWDIAGLALSVEASPTGLRIATKYELVSGIPVDIGPGLGECLAMKDRVAEALWLEPFDTLWDYEG